MFLPSATDLGMQPAHLPTLLTHLAEVLAASGSPWAGAPLECLPDKGLAHAHVRLAGTGLLARIPKQSQLNLAPQHNLAYQRACFERAEPSGRTPALRGWLPVSQQLPRGALLVQEIQGRPPALPADLPALAETLARIHRLPLPASDDRAPLLNAADPLRALTGEIAAQAQHFEAAQLQLDAAAAVQAQLDRLQAAVAGAARPQVTLVCLDSHPGNFLLQEDGAAMLVDLEKCRYAYPGLDLAHATLYTSTTWDVQAAGAALSHEEVLAFYQHWAHAVGDVVAQPALRWHGLLRRAMWLWSLSWCAQWRVLSAQAPDAAGRGRDWSARNSSDALVAHVRNRVDHYLSPAVVLRMAAQMDAFEAHFAA